MKPIGRKVYYQHDPNRVVAVEVYTTTPDQMKTLRGIDISGNRVHVAEIVDTLGEIHEHQLGESLYSLRGKRISHIEDILQYSRETFVSQKDVNSAKTQMIWDYPPDLFELDNTNISPNMKEYIRSFDEELLGLFRVPYQSNSVCYNAFNFISFKDQDEEHLGYVPAFIFPGECIEFDKEIAGEEEYPVAVFFLGNDDSSYGRRFKTREEALKFVSLGVAGGFEELCWMN